MCDPLNDSRKVDLKRWRLHHDNEIGQALDLVIMVKLCDWRRDTLSFLGYDI